MKLKVLVDNNTCIDHYFLGEPGVSYLIEVDGINVLFDLGYSDVFIKNGIKMEVDFNNVDAVVISHSHLDHTWGLEPFIKLMTEAMLENKSVKRPSFVAHPDVFLARTFFGNDEFGMNVTKDKVAKYFTLNLSKEPVWLSEHLVFLGEIPRLNNFEAAVAIGQIETESGLQADFNSDDSALVYRGDDGLVVITGCSHSGICNIIEYAKVVAGDNRIVDVIGGFHLMNTPNAQLLPTVDYFKSLGLDQLHACHCTDLQAKIALAQVADLKEVGVGMVLQWK